MFEARHPLRASPSEFGVLRCDLPRPHVTREPACDGSHGPGGSITGAREDPEQVGDRVVLFVVHFLEQCNAAANYVF